MDDCQTKRDKQVPLELDRFNGSIGNLKDAIDGLKKSLSPVLREPDPRDETANAKDENPKCDLANTIVSCRQRVEGFAASIRELTGRIEV